VVPIAVLGEKSSCPWMSQDKIYDTSLKSRNKGATTKKKQEENKPLSRRKIINIQNPFVF
jgi:hypothetical protein